MGWTLADVPQRVTWRAVWAWLTHCPPGSATYRARTEVQQDEQDDANRALVAAAEAIGW